MVMRHPHVSLNGGSELSSHLFDALNEAVLGVHVVDGFRGHDDVIVSAKPLRPSTKMGTACSSPLLKHQRVPSTLCV